VSGDERTSLPVVETPRRVELGTQFEVQETALPVVETPRRVELGTQFEVQETALPVVETPRHVELGTQFEVQEIACDGIVTLVLAGELDLGSRPVLEGCLAETCEGHTSTVVLDLSKLTLIGSAGVGALLYAARHCAETGVELLVVPGQGPARRVLELAGVLDQLKT